MIIIIIIITIVEKDMYVSMYNTCINGSIRIPYSSNRCELAIITSKRKKG